MYHSCTCGKKMDMSRNDETYYSTSELTVLLYLNIHVVFTGYLSLYLIINNYHKSDRWFCR